MRSLCFFSFSFLIYNACAMKFLNDVQSSSNVQYTWIMQWTLCKTYFNHSTVHIDFEVDMHTVLRDAIPSATIKCCRFHLWRKVQTIGIGAHYKDNQKLRKLSQRIICQTVLTTRTAIHLLTIYWRTMWHFTQGLLQTCGRRELIMAQNSFTFTLTNSSTHLIQPFSYLSSCI